MGQITKQRPQREREDATPADMPAKNVDSDAIKAELDELLDEIDGVLEENAEDFVKGYRQAGGE